LIKETEEALFATAAAVKTQEPELFESRIPQTDFSIGYPRLGFLKHFERGGYMIVREVHECRETSPCLGLCPNPWKPFADGSPESFE
jgi:hypothetical protein